MKYIFTIVITLFYSVTLVFANCNGFGNHTITAFNLTIDLANRTSEISTSPNSSTTLINKRVIVPAGYTLTIKGSSTTQLNVLFEPTCGITVQPGGFLKIEYCNLDRSGNACQENVGGLTVYDVYTWNGITIKGNPLQTHYDWVDETNGWDPYAEPFKIWGGYKTLSGQAAHGRLQMRWCNVEGTYLEYSHNLKDNEDNGTLYLKESMYGNFAIRSTEGGILDIVACDFTENYRAILIDNYELQNPATRLQNAFHIIDCDFDVSLDMRSTTEKYKNCIELFEAQRVVIEGCVFNSLGVDVQINNNKSRGTAILANYASIFLHKSGNFRRERDVDTLTSSGIKDCLKYGLEQDLDGYPSGHPWKDSVQNMRKCVFNHFYMALNHNDGNFNTAPLSTTVVDDAEFWHNSFSIRLIENAKPVISHCIFEFDETEALFTTQSYTDPVSNRFYDSYTDNSYEANIYDLCFIVLGSVANAVISENTFSSKFHDVALSQGEFKHITDIKQVSSKGYHLVYKNIFKNLNTAHNKGIALWASGGGTQLKEYIYINCDSFSNFRYGIFLGKNLTELKNQYHYLDETNGQNGEWLNTFTGNGFDIGYPGANSTTTTIFYKTGTTAPSCNKTITKTPVNEGYACTSLDCSRYPVNNPKSDKKIKADFALYPNPIAQGQNLHLQWNENNAAKKIEIYDIMGKMVFEQSVAKNSFSTNIAIGLVKGNYVVVVKSDNIGQQYKLVVY